MGRFGATAGRLDGIPTRIDEPNQSSPGSTSQVSHSIAVAYDSVAIASEQQGFQPY